MQKTANKTSSKINKTDQSKLFNQCTIRSNYKSCFLIFFSPIFLASQIVIRTKISKIHNGQWTQYRNDCGRAPSSSLSKQLNFSVVSWWLGKTRARATRKQKISWLNRTIELLNNKLHLWVVYISIFQFFFRIFGVLSRIIWNSDFDLTLKFLRRTE